MEFIESFPYVVKYKKGKDNIVVDALSRKLILLADDSQVQEINCSTFQIRRGCRTHEELKVLVSKNDK